MLIIHHNDADGRCAAAVVGRSSYAKDERAQGRAVEFLEANHNLLKRKDWMDHMWYRALHSDNPMVFVVDFCLPEEEMLKMDRAVQLYWIDHHVSCRDFKLDQVKGLRDFADKRRSGCELAWDFCFPHKPAPEIVTLIGDYDTWRLHCESRSKPLIVAMDSHQYGPDAAIWDELLLGKASSTLVGTLVGDGATMTLYRDGYARGCRESFGFETVFHGIRCYALNIGRMGSAMFGEKFKEYDACLSFFYDGMNFAVSMYSEKPEIDCAAICREHGGGGHRGAAGFTCMALPFNK